jgi:hypothetical protein
MAGRYDGPRSGDFPFPSSEADMSSSRPTLAALAVLLITSGCGRISSAAGPARERPIASARPASVPAAPIAATPRPQFQPYPIVDRQQGGLVVGTLAVPAGWQATSRVAWNYAECSFPVRMAARVASPDGSAWIETFSSELFYWLEPGDTSTPVGGSSLGMIHKPGIGVAEAMQRYLIGRYRGRAQNLKVVGFRQIPNLPQALGKQAIPGDSLAARIHYTVNGHQVDEELFCLLTARQRIPYHGPQGTTFEDHRYLGYAFAMGAVDGKLDSMNPLLGYIASSFRPDPVWERHRDQVQARLNAQFNANIARGYQRIAAAGALSRQISANNDAMIASMDAQRAASNRASARSSYASSDGFDQYIRGTERMQDPYWGTSEQSYNSQYHWTDGSGNYRHSNDAGFDPNVGSNQSWTLMQPAK